MKINGKHYRSVWPADNGIDVCIFDQTKLPFEVSIITLTTMEEAATSIKDMWVRGAPLIGAVAAYGVALAMHRDSSDAALKNAYDVLVATRPTAINLKWALDRICGALTPLPAAERGDAAYRIAAEIADEDAEICHRIGEHGLTIIRDIAARKKPGEPVNILTHCNAGWLATVDWGTALSPIYQAYDEGINIHVWVDETRPRNQGGLTAFELGSHGVPHTLIADNAGGT
ncbi:s-methyl-5-thioribose-1-phosphate isomerase [Morganella morganii]|nr:s-methyl-5-thioribose-1-phosphate isomerase [Morganella morganii]